MFVLLVEPESGDLACMMLNIKMDIECVYLHLLNLCWVAVLVKQSGFVKKTPHPLFLMDNIKMDRIPTKLNEKYIPFLHFISSFEFTSYKICKIQPPDLLFLFLLDFASAGIYISFF